MTENQNFRVINNLPVKPTPEELSTKRKGVRKFKLPTFTNGEYASHPQIGSYKVFFNDIPYFEWQVVGEENKRASFNDLCTKDERKLDRLNLGWLIADLYSFQKNIDIQHIADPYETMRLLSWYAKIENPWRRWAQSSIENILL